MFLRPLRPPYSLCQQVIEADADFGRELRRHERIAVMDPLRGIGAGLTLLMGVDAPIC